jgi:hypothetical protein
VDGSKIGPLLRAGAFGLVGIGAGAHAFMFALAPKKARKRAVAASHKELASATRDYGYGNDCSWLRRYSWARYEACIGVY